MPIKSQPDFPRDGTVYFLECDICPAFGQVFVSRLDRVARRPPDMNGWRVRGGRAECPSCVAAGCDQLAEEMLSIAQYI